MLFLSLSLQYTQKACHSFRCLKSFAYCIKNIQYSYYCILLMSLTVHVERLIVAILAKPQIADLANYLRK